MSRPSSYRTHGNLELLGDVPDAREAEATRDLLNVGARMMLVMVGLFALSVLGCVSCIMLGPDRSDPAQTETQHAVP